MDDRRQSLEDADGGAHDSAEDDDAQARSAPSGRIVYKAVLGEGEGELGRPPGALAWSGLAAGLSMSASMFAQGLLTVHLPDAAWRPLVVKLGYCVGFLFVVLGRQQLFTENTLTPILPLLQQRSARTLRKVARLWAIVLVTNLVGAAIAAAVAVQTTAFEADVRVVFVAMGQNEIAHGTATTLLRAIFAGWLIALMVWLMPFAETARIWVIVVVTYLVGLGEFSHIVAGSVSVFAWALSGEGRWASAIVDFVVPCLAGNILGGTVLVALLNHAQVVAGREHEAL